MDTQAQVSGHYWKIALVGLTAIAGVTAVLILAPASSFQVASENVTGPPPMLNLPPMWTVPIAGVVALTIGLIAAQSETID